MKTTTNASGTSRSASGGCSDERYESVVYHCANFQNQAGKPIPQPQSVTKALERSMKEIPGNGR